MPLEFAIKIHAEKTDLMQEQNSNLTISITEET